MTADTQSRIQNLLQSEQVHLNPSVPDLYGHALRLGEGQIAQGGPLAVRTNKTGRSPKDLSLIHI